LEAFADPYSNKPTLEKDGSGQCFLPSDLLQLLHMEHLLHIGYIWVYMYRPMGRESRFWEVVFSIDPFPLSSSLSVCSWRRAQFCSGQSVHMGRNVKGAERH